MRLPEFKAQPSPGGGAFPAVLKQVWPWVALVVVAGVIFFASLHETRKGDVPEGQTGVPPEAGPSVADPAEFKRGYELSKQVCQTCHLYPEPQLLDRFTWSFEVLPKMGFWMGYEKYDFDKEPGGQRVKEANIIPQAPILEFKDWRAICNYYVTAAPMKALPQASRPKIKIGLKHFQPIITTYPRKAANALVQINPGTRTLFVGNDDEHTLEVFGLNNKVEATVKFDSTPVSLLTVANGMLVTLIGSISPSDDPMGKLVLVSRPGVGPPQYREILTKLQRPTDTLVADLNKDGRDDLVICEYGNILGRCCWWENLGDHRYKEHELLDRCGSTKAQLYDINGDGLMDIFLMTAQAREGIYLFLNRGNGDFLMLPVVEQPPAWGNVYFELADFNKDGFTDILAVNGDNGDNVTYPYVLKKYHGVRIYLNDGKNHFQEAYFYPLNGAYKAVARDFDNDGDLDIAAVSYFPDYEKSRAESCVYLENKGKLAFEASSFAESISGKWISMDAADLDGDGDIDVVLGAYEGGPGAVPQLLRNVWEKHGASILILKNTIIP